MARKQAKLDPNRFKKEMKIEIDDLGMFSFDPIRQELFKWGLVSGIMGSLFTIRPELWAKVFGIIIIVVVCNYHIAKASHRIPRWHAVVVTFIGLLASIPIVMIVNAVTKTALVLYGGGG
jgi:hypothetical protein